MNVDKLTALAPLTIAFVRLIALSESFPIATYCTHNENMYSPERRHDVRPLLQSQDGVLSGELEI